MSTKIAVLPFINMSPNVENEYFSDGITEEIINALARIQNLKVTSRTSSFFFKGKSQTLSEVVEQLSVSVILEGSVRVAGNTIRITAQLIQAKEDFHFWSETWDRKLENIFKIQDEISLLIADKLREQYGHLEISDHLVPKQTESFDAYEYSLQAQYNLVQWNPKKTREAIRLWEKALASDPNHLASLVGIADAYSFMAVTQSMPYIEAWNKTQAFTEKALSIDSNSAPAHYQLANISFFRKADFQEAFRLNQKAIELKPNYPEAQQFMSFLYLIYGDKHKAKVHLDLALDIDPLNHETLFFKSYFFYCNEDFDQALKILNQNLAHNPGNIPALITKAYCLLASRREKEALNLLDEVSPELIPPADRLGIRCLAEILNEDVLTEKPHFEELLQKAQDPMAFQEHSYLFQAFANKKENDHAFLWLEKAIEMKSSILFLGYSDPLARPIFSDPRYPEYKEKLYGKIPLRKKSLEKNQLLDKETSEKYSVRLLDLIANEQAFLNPQLSLRSLADQVEIHPNQLSWLLNETIGKNFNEFINHYRVECFKKLALDSANSHISLIGLAYESGFNSKTVFNTYFKKQVGMTPKEYLKANA